MYIIDMSFMNVVFILWNNSNFPIIIQEKPCTMYVFIKNGRNTLTGKFYLLNGH